MFTFIKETSTWKTKKGATLGYISGSCPGFMATVTFSATTSNNTALLRTLVASAHSAVQKHGRALGLLQRRPISCRHIPRVGISQSWLKGTVRLVNRVPWLSTVMVVALWGNLSREQSMAVLPRCVRCHHRRRQADEQHYLHMSRQEGYSYGYNLENCPQVHPPDISAGTVPFQYAVSCRFAISAKSGTKGLAAQNIGSGARTSFQTGCPYI